MLVKLSLAVALGSLGNARRASGVNVPDQHVYKAPTTEIMGMSPRKWDRPFSDRQEMDDMMTVLANVSYKGIVMTVLAISCNIIIAPFGPCSIPFFDGRSP
jgi:hypothetical protein